MQILDPGQANVVGGAKFDYVHDVPIIDHPVPIWHPVFTTDP